MHQKIRPLFILLNPPHTDNVLIRLQSGVESATIKRLENLFQKHNPDIPFEIDFVDDAYESLYTAELKVALLSKYFAAVAIFISCLGLIGMAAFTAERRTKEIGIRKTLGASAFHIVRLLSADFTLMVALAIVLSIPLGYWFTKAWLEGFAYHVLLEWWFYVGIGIAVLAVALGTIGTQTIKAALTDPVKSLKND